MNGEKRLEKDAQNKCQNHNIMSIYSAKLKCAFVAVSLLTSDSEKKEEEKKKL